MTMTKTHGLNVLMASRLYVVYLLALPLSSFTNGEKESYSTLPNTFRIQLTIQC